MISVETMHKVQAILGNSGNCIRTPLVRFSAPLVDDSVEAFLKMENMQLAGSFKIRGILNQLENLSEEDRQKELITFSAGNYGRAFSYLCQKMGLKAKVFLPDFSPQNRLDVIKSYGAATEQIPNKQVLEGLSGRMTRPGTRLMHPYDDIRLIEGYTSCGLEILEDCPNPDIVVVCCGGGGLLAGVATAIKTMGPKHCLVYGVEPEGACCMYKSMKEGKLVEMPNASSVASGLAPPSAGESCFTLCQQYVDGILLLTEEELKAGVRALFTSGVVAEAAGGAAFAALLHGKIPNSLGKKIVMTVSGRNASAQEMAAMFGEQANSTIFP